MTDLQQELDALAAKTVATLEAENAARNTLIAEAEALVAKHAVGPLAPQSRLPELIADSCAHSVALAQRLIEVIPRKQP